MAGKGEPKTGGRQKGTPNKKTIEIQEKFRRYRYDPVSRAIKIAQDKETPIEVKARIALELIQYHYPKRKAIEHSGEIEFDHHVIEAPPEIPLEEWPYVQRNGHTTHTEDD